MNCLLKIGAVSIAFGLVASAASAESFTFKSTSHVANSVVVDTGTPPGIADIFNTGEATIVYDTGNKEANTSSCASWTVPPGTAFSSNGICTFATKKGDQGTIIFGCRDDNANHTSDCWGGLRGTAGRFTGKTGTISWHQSLDADGKTGMATGVGMWN